MRKSKKPKSKRKRGGQKGHKGSHRQLLPTAEVDKHVHLYADACEACARLLPQVPDPDAKRYQQIELLVGGGRVVTQWYRHGSTCLCGHTTVAEYDSEKLPASAFGPRLTSVVATLTGVYHLSRRNTKMLLREVFGIEMSVGAISQMEARVSKALQPASEEAHAQVVAALVKHTDARLSEMKWEKGGAGEYGGRPAAQSTRRGLRGRRTPREVGPPTRYSDVSSLLPAARSLPSPASGFAGCRSLRPAGSADRPPSRSLPGVVVACGPGRQRRPRPAGSAYRPPSLSVHVEGAARATVAVETTMAVAPPNRAPIRANALRRSRLRRDRTSAGSRVFFGSDMVHFNVGGTYEALKATRHR